MGAPRGLRGFFVRALAAAVLLAWACDRTGLDAQRAITDEEIAALDLPQGLAGHSWMTVGNCFPSTCVWATCVRKKIPATLVVVEGPLPLNGPTLEQANCAMTNPTGGWPDMFRYTLADAGVGARVDLTWLDTYAVALDAGTYSVVVVDTDGCGWCETGVEQDDGGVPYCAPVRVEPGRVTPLDVHHLMASG